MITALLMFCVKAGLWIVALPFKIIYKLLFWWLPTGPDYGYHDDYYHHHKH